MIHIDQRTVRFFCSLVTLAAEMTRCSRSDQEDEVLHPTGGIVNLF